MLGTLIAPQSLCLFLLAIPMSNTLFLDIFGPKHMSSYDLIDSDGELNGCWDEDECGPLAFHEQLHH